MASSAMEEILNKFNTLTEKPIKFLAVQKEIKDDVKSLVKSIYDYTKTQEEFSKKEKKSALPELIVEDFDEEQIWQEIELQNSDRWDQLVWEVANCISTKNDLKFPIRTEEKQNDQASEENEDEPVSEDENMDINEDEELHDKPKQKVLKNTNKLSTMNGKPSIVDDDFFKLQEMERFLINEERNDGSKPKQDSDEESIDFFEDVDDDDLEEDEQHKDMMYSDFFDGGESQDIESDENESIDVDYEQKTPEKIKKKVKFADNVSSDGDDKSDGDSNDSDKNKHAEPEPAEKISYEKPSEFEQRQQRLKQTIDRLEDKMLKEASWQLKGEVDALKRPQNSLLEEVVDTDFISRPPPVITEQTTYTLEEIIKQRIKDKSWDDVVKKQKPVEDQSSFRKPVVLDQSKSQQSLAQIYEAEYLKQKQALSGDIVEEDEPESHKVIRKAMSELFNKLDALSNYHYTPKAPQAEVRIVSNTPAISMEEVAPVATSDATLLAPEEIKPKQRGNLMSKEERTRTDRNRERRHKKKHQKIKGMAKKITVNNNKK